MKQANLVCLAVVLGLAAFGREPAPTEDQGKPNIILRMTDDK